MVTTVLEFSANEIIIDALEDLGIIPPTQTPAAEDTAKCLRIMNRLLKAWQAPPMKLWLQTEGIVFLNPSQQLYRLGPGGDNATNFDTLITTRTTADLVVLDLVITLESTQDISGAPELITIDPINTQFWTTGADATLSFVDPDLSLENTDGPDNFTDFTLTCDIGSNYRITVSVVISSTPARFDIIDPVSATVIQTVTASATGTFVINFTATQISMTLRWQNTDTTDLFASLLSSLSQIDVDSGDFIGIQQTDNTRHWTTVVEVLTSTTLEIATGMPVTSTIQSIVYAYTDGLVRPLHMYNPRSATSGTSFELPIERMWARKDYMQQPIKDTTGTVLQAYYNPQLGKGELRVWPTAANINDTFLFTYDDPFIVLESQIEDPNIPAEWAMALQYGLEKKLLGSYTVPPDRVARVEAMAERTLTDARADGSPYNMRISPNFRN
ncbi:MAG: hypothetical protein V3V84_08335 [Candidatus Bathyarchaeia archaeon]